LICREAVSFPCEESDLSSEAGSFPYKSAAAGDTERATAPKTQQILAVTDAGAIIAHIRSKLPGLEQTKHFQNHDDNDNYSDDVEDISVHVIRE
jgi:hypothetical protein